jgi:hypothetical protein
MASLVLDGDLAAGNELVDALGLRGETHDGLRRRVNA